MRTRLVQALATIAENGEIPESMQCVTPEENGRRLAQQMKERCGSIKRKGTVERAREEVEAEALSILEQAR